MQHSVETLGLYSGRRIEDFTNSKWDDIGFYKESGLPIGKTPVMLIRDSKNNTDQERHATVLPVFPNFGNYFICAALVSTDTPCISCHYSATVP